METVADVLRYKGNTIFGVAPEVRVITAVERMCEKHVGAVLVESARVPLGIFTERDLMRRVILARRDPVETRVEEVMTTQVICVEPDTEVREAMALMTERRCRHLPVVDGGSVIGMLSIGDLVRWMSQEQAFEIQLLTDYVRGAYS
jgi:signal-transduction protein with cAMP-binding, CBS, and nucleotidyltransferase domain